MQPQHHLGGGEERVTVPFCSGRQISLAHHQAGAAPRCPQAHPTPRRRPCWLAPRLREQMPTSWHISPGGELACELQVIPSTGRCLSSERDPRDMLDSMFHARKPSRLSQNMLGYSIAKNIPIKDCFATVLVYEACENCRVMQP